MSEVKFHVCDVDRAIHATWHGSFANRAIAALSAEPETIEELEVALQRFAAADERGFFRGFRPGIDEEPYDAGIVIIDLAARLMVCDSTYSSVGPRGEVSYHDGSAATEISIRYHLSEDWLILRDATDWQATANGRRRQRLSDPPLDSRAVLFGDPLLEFIGRESLRSVQEGQLCNDSDGSSIRSCARQIHAAWMTQTRDDLRAQSPRDILLAKTSFIDCDLWDRSEQWTMQGRCPQGLSKNTAAYRFGGFGTHEIVCYYDLVRFLIEVCCHDAIKLAAAGPSRSDSSNAMTGADFLTTQVPKLANLREAWLDKPNLDYSGHIPRKVIDHERRRIPESLTGHEAMVDCDCPLCQIQADLPGPGFWRLDGCNMDDDFAFSFHRTKEEWEKERRKWQEFNDRFSETQAVKQQLGVECHGGGYSDPDYVWQRSFSSDESLTSESLLMRLFAIGSHLCELIYDLKRPTENRGLIDQLSRDFGNLREVSQSPDLETVEALFEPVMQRFCDTLTEVATERPDLEAKCSDLQQRVDRFLTPPRENVDSDDEFNDGGEMPY